MDLVIVQSLKISFMNEFVSGVYKFMTAKRIEIAEVKSLLKCYNDSLTEMSLKTNQSKNNIFISSIDQLLNKYKRNDKEIFEA